ncbi:MAG: isoprenylcysteine carboxylmethyltransferase family protein [Dehalococcoidales bacterium]|nr:isoprenylcysteine carboxylmethyltransferase family protein [Dehalococcoidales bacterium]
MNIKALVGRVFFIAVSTAVIAVIAGGASFIRDPVGITYLMLWIAWWVVTTLGRQPGTPSAYDEKRWLIVVLGVVGMTILIFVAPWEYTHFTGPIPRNGSVAWAGLTLLTSGIILQTLAMWWLRGFYTVRLNIQQKQRLVTDGPYRLVRHPGYLSYLVSLTGLGLALGSLAALGLVLLAIPFLVWRITKEEEMLVTAFGKEYINYLRQTRWRLVPFIY